MGDEQVTPNLWRARLKAATPYAKLVVGLGTLVLLVVWVDWPATWSQLKDARPAWVALGIGLTLVQLVLKAARSGLLLDLVDVRLSRWQVFEAYMAGQAMNILLPLRAGDVARLGMLSAARPGRTTESASTIVVEKVLDTAALALLVGGILIFLPQGFASPALATVLPGLGILFVGMTVLFGIAFGLWPQISGRLHDTSLAWLSGTLGHLDETMLRWRALLRHPSALFPAALVTAANWLLKWVMNLIIFRAANLALGSEAAAIVLALVMIGMLPALSPGDIGPFQLFAALGLMPFNIPVEQGVAFAIILNGVVMLPALLIGGITLLYSSGRSNEATSPDIEKHAP